MSESFASWADAMKALATRMQALDLGYPVGEHMVMPPAQERPTIPAPLRNLYAVCDGVSFPDVHNGFFIDTCARLVTASGRGEPTVVQASPTRNIQVFGSDGGGGRFALDLDDGSILYLPSSGAVRHGVYEAAPAHPVRVLARELLEFLARLKLDVEIFLQGDSARGYLSS